MNKSIIFLLVGIIIVIGVTGVFLTTSTDTQKQDENKLPSVVNVGVILPASGDLASHGQDNNIAVQLALKDFNEYLESINAEWKMNLTVEDSQTDPIIALEKIQSLKSKGIDLILGTETSSELRNVKSYADSNNMLLISPSSTSPKLAIDDNIFRFVPDDTKQGKVISQLLLHDNIKVIIPVYRGDVWGDGLYESTKKSFDMKGGIVDKGIRYSPEITVFSTEANLLSDRLEMHSETYAIDEIGILMIGFSETVHFLNFASSYDNLHNVRWFGSDASSNDDAITDDKIASKFAENVSFISTQFSASKNEVYDRVKDHLISEIGSSPNNYAYSSYDSLWVLGLSIQETQSLDANTLKNTIPDIASNHVGSIGKIMLNENGDLDNSDYELWAIVDGKWVLTGHYYSESEFIELF